MFNQYYGIICLLSYFLIVIPQAFGDSHFVDILEFKQHSNSVMLNNRGVCHTPKRQSLVMESGVVWDDSAGI